MNKLARAYVGLIDGLAGIAGAMMGVLALSVVVDVTIRSLGGKPPEWTVPLSEYLLLYMTLLGAPWVLREKGHVLVDSFVAALPPVAKRTMAGLVYAACAVACCVVVWFTAGATVHEFVAGTTDVRAVAVPKWMLSAPFVPGFALMATEFVRFLLGRDSLYAGGETHGVA